MQKAGLFCLLTLAYQGILFLNSQVLLFHKHFSKEVTRRNEMERN